LQIDDPLRTLAGGMSERVIQPPSEPFTATLTPPGSKSMTNRALVFAALAAGRSTLRNVLFADDTRVMLDSLRKLGFELDIDEAVHSVGVAGGGGKIAASTAELFCGNSGTTIRFLTALCSLGKGQFTLDGVPRMRQRPIAELAQLLRHLGVRIGFGGEEGFPPVMVHADGLPGGLLQFGSAMSSQFLSAVLMVSPFARHEVRIDLTGPQTSWPYVAMTMRMMDEFDVIPELIRDPVTGEPKRIIIPREEYRGRKYEIEPDASNAAYFLAAAAIHPGAKMTITGLGRNSLQGDVGFADVLAQMGAAVKVDADSIEVAGPQDLRGIEVDLSAMPDTAQTLAVVALFAHGRTTIRGLHTLRVKETDRLAALSTELARLGAAVAVEGDALRIDAPMKIRPAAIDTYDDHRMAMSFALAATRVAGVTIKDAQCVNKTYPEFFGDLDRVLLQH
jgi:3-phosphoshikimate 1-carboxyvinyltransferase